MVVHHMSLEQTIGFTKNFSVGDNAVFFNDELSFRQTFQMSNIVEARFTCLAIPPAVIKFYSGEQLRLASVGRELDYSQEFTVNTPPFLATYDVYQNSKVYNNLLPPYNYFEGLWNWYRELFSLMGWGNINLRIYLHDGFFDTVPRNILLENSYTLAGPSYFNCLGYDWAYQQYLIDMINVAQELCNNINQVSPELSAVYGYNGQFLPYQYYVRETLGGVLLRTTTLDKPTNFFGSGTTWRFPLTSRQPENLTLLGDSGKYHQEEFFNIFPNRPNLNVGGVGLVPIVSASRTRTAKRDLHGAGDKRYIIIRDRALTFSWQMYSANEDFTDVDTFFPYPPPNDGIEINRYYFGAAIEIPHPGYRMIAVPRGGALTAVTLGEAVAFNPGSFDDVQRYEIDPPPVFTPVNTLLAKAGSSTFIGDVNSAIASSEIITDGSAQSYLEALQAVGFTYESIEPLADGTGYFIINPSLPPDRDVYQFVVATNYFIRHQYPSTGIVTEYVTNFYTADSQNWVIGTGPLGWPIGSGVGSPLNSDTYSNLIPYHVRFNTNEVYEEAMNTSSIGSIGVSWDGTFFNPGSSFLGGYYSFNCNLRVPEDTSGFNTGFVRFTCTDKIGFAIPLGGVSFKDKFGVRLSNQIASNFYTRKLDPSLNVNENLIGVPYTGFKVYVKNSNWTGTKRLGFTTLNVSSDYNTIAEEYRYTTANANNYTIDLFNQFNGGTLLFETSFTELETPTSDVNRVHTLDLSGLDAILSTPCNSIIFYSELTPGSVTGVDIFDVFKDIMVNGGEPLAIGVGYEYYGSRSSGGTCILNKPTPFDRNNYDFYDRATIEISNMLCFPLKSPIWSYTT